MSKQFIPTRGTPCEICEDRTGDCRTTQIQLGNVSVTQHLCLKQPDGGDTPTHKYFGLTKDGLWGKYIAFNELPDKNSHTQEEKRRWQRERENRLKQQKQAELQKLANSLSIEERDRVIRLLHKYWGLSRADRQRIRDRSFTDEQINQRCYFSLSAFPKC